MGIFNATNLSLKILYEKGILTDEYNSFIKDGSVVICFCIINFLSYLPGDNILSRGKENNYFESYRPFWPIDQTTLFKSKRIKIYKVSSDHFNFIYER